MVADEPAPLLIPLLAAAGVAVVVLLAEWLHLCRIRRLRWLVFGGERIPRLVSFVPAIRVAACGGLVWALMTLMLLPTRTFKPGQGADIPFQRLKHIVLVLDVSPSMRLQDAGIKLDQSRMVRAREVLESYFQRVAMNEHRTSVIATYTKSLPVVEDTKDVNVVRNILSDLPMHFAFRVGDTDLFSGIEAASTAAKGWRPKSATVIIVSDGDTVPATGMPRMPASVAEVLVVGVGDHTKGSFINGRNSRQDVSTLKQIAARLKGTYHNGNEKHLPTTLINRLTQQMEGEQLSSWTLREWAMLVMLCSGAVLGLLPVILHFLGTTWQPGLVRRSADLIRRTDSAVEQRMTVG